VEATNELLDEAPETVNSDPYGEAWFAVIAGDTGPVEALMDPAAYAEFSE
jgi:glycine cleavage system H protein